MINFSINIFVKGILDTLSKKLCHIVSYRHCVTSCHTDTVSCHVMSCHKQFRNVSSSRLWLILPHSWRPSVASSNSLPLNKRVRRLRPRLRDRQIVTDVVTSLHDHLRTLYDIYYTLSLNQIYVVYSISILIKKHSK